MRRTRSPAGGYRTRAVPMASSSDTRPPKIRVSLWESAMPTAGHEPGMRSVTTSAVGHVEQPVTVRGLSGDQRPVDQAAARAEGLPSGELPATGNGLRGHATRAASGCPHAIGRSGISDLTTRLPENSQGIGVAFPQTSQGEVLLGQRGQDLKALPGVAVAGERDAGKRRHHLQEPNGQPQPRAVGAFC